MIQPTLPDSRIEAVLDAQLVALQRGDAFSFDPAQFRLNAVEAASAHELLMLTQALKSALLTALPAEAFVERLKMELLGGATATLSERWRKLPANYRMAARLGGLTLTAGLALLASRRVMGLVTTLQDTRTKAKEIVVG
jgi:hypothetical protein